MQGNHSDCSSVAQHAQVLGSDSHVKPDSRMPAHSADSALQSDSPKESVESKYTCLAPRA